jgi:hypothetical protein
MYTEQIEYSQTGMYGTDPLDKDDVYTIAEFKEFCEEKLFIDYDGFGHPAKGDLADTSIIIKPSALNLIPEDATHIVWYNR